MDEAKEEKKVTDLIIILKQLREAYACDVKVSLLVRLDEVVLLGTQSTREFYVDSYGDESEAGGFSLKKIDVKLLSAGFKRPDYIG